MKPRNERNAPRNLSPFDAITASLVIDGTIWALLETAPIAAAELDAAEPFERRMRLGSHCISPHVRFTADEWERMSLDYYDAMREAARSRFGTEHSGRVYTWGQSPEKANGASP
jgi:hypothetical protein